MVDKKLVARRMASAGLQRSDAIDDGPKKNNGRRQNRSNRQQQQNHTSKRPIKIETNQFASRFHSEICRAARYKVHSPLCSCNKIEKLRQRYHKELNNNKSVEEQLKKLDITDPFDNLLVVPESKTTPAIYVCRGADENKLANEIFDYSANDASFVALPFKVSCAICLLAHQKNGFAAIIADSAQELQLTVDKARKAASEIAVNQQLHADHAHFISAVKLSSFRSLLQSGKTRSKHFEIVSEIATQLKEGGVDLTPAIDNTWTMKLGHHLTSLLLLEGRLKNKRNDRYCMVLGYTDGPTKISFDLPGGKRHLGESTLESLVREVKEECSLELDKVWLKERLSRRYGGLLEEKCEEVLALESKKEGGNVYFVIPPFNG